MKARFITILVAIATFISQVSMAQFTVNGNASDISTKKAPTSFRLTPDVVNQKGNVWNNTKIDIKNNSFVLTFQANFGTKDGSGADGIGLVFHNDTRGVKALGAGTEGKYIGFKDVKPSLGIEFDTYDNSTASGDISTDHISINKNGSTDAINQLTKPVAARANSGNIEDGAMHNVRVEWEALSRTFSVYFDGSLRQMYTNDVVNTIFGGNGSVFWGFTSSTGGSTNQHAVYQLSMVLSPVVIDKTPAPLPVTLINFAAATFANGTMLTWATATEDNSDYFQVERSADAKNWDAVTKVTSHHNSNSRRDYTFNDAAAPAGSSYYRLKMVDLDGTFEYSKVVSVKAGGLRTAAIAAYPNPVQNGQALQVRFTSAQNAPVTVILSDLSGTVVVKTTGNCLAGENAYAVNTSSLKPGMYLVQVISGTAKETTRVLVK